VHHHSHRSPLVGGQGKATITDNGTDWGKLVINNWCEDTLNVWSVGVWQINGNASKDPADGFGTDEEAIKHVIESGGTYSEPFRVTCPYPKGWTMETAFDLNADWIKDADVTTYKQLVSTKKKDDQGRWLTSGWCIPEDKLAGQGVAIKIAKGDAPVQGTLLQLEYALVKDPNRVDPNNGVRDDFHRINYDVSLLDCGIERANQSDFNPTPEMLQEKFEMCPGYKGGLSLTFDNDTKSENCPPTFCSADKTCLMAYLWDRTRKGESSLSCEKEYKGNMILNLCVGNAKNTTIAT
jgi:hypothetical protein